VCLHCLATQHILLVQQVRCARPCDGEMPSNRQPPGRVSVGVGAVFSRRAGEVLARPLFLACASDSREMWLRFFLQVFPKQAS